MIIIIIIKGVQMECVMRRAEIAHVKIDVVMECVLRVALLIGTAALSLFPS